MHLKTENIKFKEVANMKQHAVLWFKPKLKMNYKTKNNSINKASFLHISINDI